MRARAAALLLVAGCSQSGSTVLLEVSSSRPLSVKELVVAAQLAGISRSFEVGLTTPTFPPDHSIAIQVAPELSGTMTVFVDARDPGGALVAGGNGVVQVTPGEESQLSIVLNLEPPDGGIDARVDGAADASQDGAVDAAPDLAGTCMTHADCTTTLVCRPDHTCAQASDVSYVDNGGMDPANCNLNRPMQDGSLMNPYCEIPTGLDQPTSFVHVAGSTVAYAPLSASKMSWGGKIVVGPGSRATPLATIKQDGSLGGDALNFQIGLMTFDGIDFYGQVDCTATGTLKLYDVSVHDSTIDGVSVGGCSLVYSGGTIKRAAASGVRTNNPSASVVLVDVKIAASATAMVEPTSGVAPAAVYLDGGGTISVDRCLIGPQNGQGIYLAAGTYSITNTFIVDNTGLALNPWGPGSGLFQFNTVANNARGVFCANPMGTVLEASIFSGNAVNMSEFNSANNCALINGTTTSADATQPIFADPASEDYRLALNRNNNTTCCIDKVHGAIDGGAATLSGHDYFNFMRPVGQGWDVGAHEVQ
jgi:hypothetical protein